MLTKILKRKLSVLHYLILDRCFKRSPKIPNRSGYFFTGYETKKHAMFCFAKWYILTLQKLDVIYCLTFPGCNKNYFEKINKLIIKKKQIPTTCLLNEHGSCDNQPMHQHLLKCECFMR